MLSVKNRRIFVLGKEGTGWSIDKDRKFVISALTKMGYKITRNILFSDVIYVVWWNQILSKKYKFLLRVLRKKIVAVITNDLEHQKEEIKKCLDVVDRFVVANTKQKLDLIDLGVKQEDIFYNPYFVDDKVFFKMEENKNWIANKLGIPNLKLDNKIVIGSFQRDSLGQNLAKPKWQKNPDYIVDIMDKLDRSKYILLLAGPRRHYLVRKLRKMNIDYIYVGDESFIDKLEDDIKSNNICDDDMNLLYNLTDIYIVTSTSEGGPKAIPESMLTKTMIYSTKVGFAEDLLNIESIYYDVNSLAIKMIQLSSDEEEKIVKENYNKISSVYNETSFKRRLSEVIESL